MIRLTHSLQSWDLESPAIVAFALLLPSTFASRPNDTYLERIRRNQPALLSTDSLSHVRNVPQQEHMRPRSSPQLQTLKAGLPRLFSSSSLNCSIKVGVKFQRSPRGHLGDLGTWNSPALALPTSITCGSRRRKQCILRLSVAYADVSADALSKPPLRRAGSSCQLLDADNVCIPSVRLSPQVFHNSELYVRVSVAVMVHEMARLCGLFETPPDVVEGYRTFGLALLMELLTLSVG